MFASVRKINKQLDVLFFVDKSLHEEILGQFAVDTMHT